MDFGRVRLGRSMEADRPHYTGPQQSGEAACEPGKDTYQVRHRDLGSVGALFLVPIGSTQGARHLEAVFG